MRFARANAAWLESMRSDVMVSPRVDPLSRDPLHQSLWGSVTMEFAHGRCAWFALVAAEELLGKS